MESAPNFVDERVKGGRAHPNQAALPLPFVSGPSRRLETRHPVDRRAAARGLRGTRMRRGVPNGRPVRVDAALEGLRIREEQDEPLHGLEALTLDPEPTVGPCQEKSLPFRLGPRRESLRTSGEEEVRPRV